MGPFPRLAFVLSTVFKIVDVDTGSRVHDVSLDEISAGMNLKQNL